MAVKYSQRLSYVLNAIPYVKFLEQSNYVINSNCYYWFRNLNMHSSLIRRHQPRLLRVCSVESNGLFWGRWQPDGVQGSWERGWQMLWQHVNVCEVSWLQNLSCPVEQKTHRKPNISIKDLSIIRAEDLSWGGENTIVVIVVVQLFKLYLSVAPWTVAHQAPLSLGSPSLEHWSGLPFPPPGDLPKQGIKL